MLRHTLQIYGANSLKNEASYGEKLFISDTFRDKHTVC